MTTINAKFEIEHTKGDTLDVTIPFEDGDGVDIDWSALGYVSATSQVRKDSDSGIKLLDINVDISVDGAMRLYTDEVVDIDSGIYYYDVKMVKNGGQKETWFTGKPIKFIINEDITR